MTKQTRILAALGLAAVTAASTASAQSVRLTARVPFDFHVNGSSLPRDVYRLAPANDGSSTLMLRSDRKAVVVLVQQGRPYDSMADSHLVFHRVGQQYFLREVRFEGSTGLALPESRDERAAIDRIASAGPGGVERVVIRAAR